MVSFAFPEISIIPAVKSIGAQRLCLRSIASQRVERNRFEVLVVTDREEDDTNKVVREFVDDGMQIDWFRVRRHGVNEARNLGLRRARGRILVFLDDNCQLSHPEWLERLIELHARHPQVAMIGGEYLSSAAADSRSHVYNNIVNARLRSQASAKEGKIFLLSGNMTIKRNRIPIGARFDETFSHGGGEVSFQKEIFAAGESSRIEQDLNVWHEFDGSWIQLPRKAWLQDPARRGFSQRRETLNFNA